MNSRPKFLAALLLAGALSVPSALAAPRGPAFGANKYTTAIQSAGAVDTDDYVAPLIEGERLTVVVTASRRSALRPKIELVAPSGDVLSPTTRPRRRGKSVSLRAFVIDATGEWAVRVGGDSGTEGAYTVSFRVVKAPPVRARRQSLGDADPLTRTHDVPAVDGALLDLSVTWRPRSTAVEVRAIDDPQGDPVPGAGGDAVDDVFVKRRRAKLPRTAVATGHGAYAVGVGIDAGTANYDLLARVMPQGRPRQRRPIKLGVDEPGIGAGGGVIRGIAGRPVLIDGVNFGDPVSGDDPTVFFGDVPGTDVTVAPSGLRLTVTPPPGAEGSTVALSVVNPDGQASTRADAFFYAPAPTVTGLVDTLGAPLLGGTTGGGQIVRVLGTGLVSDHTVLFGTRTATIVLSSGTTELRVATPVSPAGTVSVTVVDEFDRSALAPTTFTFKTPPAFAANPYSPALGRPNEAVVVTISGTNFEAADELLYDGVVRTSPVMNSTTRTLSLDPTAAGAHTVALRDSIGTIVAGPDFVFKDAATITSVMAVAGAYSPPADVPLLGGATIEVLGTGFHFSDTVTLGADTVTVTDRTPTSFRFVASPGAAGPRTLRIVDGIGQAASLASAVNYVGFEDATATGSPGGSATDDLTALRGAIGDLDEDGEDDDLVIVSYDYYRGNVYRGYRVGGAGTANSPGSRAEYTRIFFGAGDGTLADKTATNFPVATTGSYPDNWNAMAVAIGDLDGTAGNEIVIGGVSPYYPLYNDVRIFANDGSGTFTLETTNPIPSTYLGVLYAYDENATQHVVFSQRYVPGLPTSIAIGDIDGDDDLDVVVGRDFYDSTYLYVDPTNVDFTQTPPYVQSTYTVAPYLLQRVDYYPATQVFQNDIAGGYGFVDRTPFDMPSAGNSALPIVPAFHAEDVALGDLDGDDDLDLVLTWPDPTTVTVLGMYELNATGSTTQAPQVATRVLTNDGSGVFTDATVAWLAAGAGNEFWQGHRMALADLDGDDDLDLLLLLHDSINAYLGTPTFGQHALRVLRNDGAATGFTDVTTTVLPALPTDSNDNLRGDALRVADVNLDGHMDVLVGTRQTITTNGGTRLRSTRLLLGTGAFKFILASDFLPPATADTGEAEDLLVGDLGGASAPNLILLTEKPPTTSPATENLRILDWKR